MFSKIPEENRFNYLKHDRIPIENLIEGVVFKLETFFNTWNLGLSFIDMNVDDYSISQDPNGITSGVKDLVFKANNKRRPPRKDFLSSVTLFELNKSRLTPIKESNELRTIDVSTDFVKSSSFEVYLKYIPGESSLYISFYSSAGLFIQTFINLPYRPLFLRLFTFGPFSGSDFVVQYHSYGGNSTRSDAFRLKNIVVRKGDVFNSDPVLNTNLVVFPTSPSGAINFNYIQRLEYLQVEAPGQGEIGELKVANIPGSKFFYFGFAYPTKEGRSSASVVRKICRKLLALYEQENSKFDIRGLNLPLLGTGSSGLSALEVMAIYDSAFNVGRRKTPVIVVSVQSPEVYHALYEKYRKRIVPLIHEYQNNKPGEIVALEKALNITVPFENFEMDFLGNVYFLDLQNQPLPSVPDYLKNFTHLKSLGLNNTPVVDIHFLRNLKHLRSLSLRGLPLTDFEVLGYLEQLVMLDLSYIERLPITRISELVPNLQQVILIHCGIEYLDFVQNLNRLQMLDLQSNRITDLQPLVHLKTLESLSICNNLIFDISPLKSLRELRYLDISNNMVLKLELDNLIEQLYVLKADQNPFVTEADLILTENSDHLQAIKNYLFRQAEQNKFPVRLPAKILLMGNHSSGKSSLLRYIQDGKPAKSVASTHIVNIEMFKESPGGDLPDAIFYDFGGQDYYHGIYRAFLSGGAINLILWNAENNENKIRIDSNNRATQDFKLDYWLAQKQYLETEKQNGVISPVLLIQTHADYVSRTNHQINAEEHGIRNDFYISLKGGKKGSPWVVDARKRALKYLKASILVLIEENQVEREEPQWYIDFLRYVISTGTTANHNSVKVKDLMKEYKRTIQNKRRFLEDDLEQLHRQGLLLYYREELPDVVWLNPVALVKYVHSTFLNKNVISERKGRVDFAVLDSENQDVLKLLVMQKVIFRHEVSGQYIIPNFLELAKKPGELELYTFGLGDPLFTLKFKYFLPFGLINQIICFFGDLPEEKRFWRDRLIFTLDGQAKVLININFQLLEIEIFTAFASNMHSIQKEQIKKYLFYGILGLYWDLDLLKFKDFIAYVDGSLKMESFAPEDPMYKKLNATDDFYNNPSCRPVDLYISLNQKDFINYTDLCSDKGSVAIVSYSKTEQGEFDGSSRSIPIYQFQAFTPYTLNRRKNVAISYSKKDLRLVNKFKDYLRPLYDDELINHPWYCTELIAGTEWDQEIQKKFDAADIIFFMISENLMATKYVLENEIKNAIDKYDREGKLMIVPIVLVPYRFQRSGTYNLGRFSAMPYTLMPITSFKNENDAWYVVSESIRIMIEKNLNPGLSDDLPSELRKHFEKIIIEATGQIVYNQTSEVSKQPQGPTLPVPPESDPIDEG